MAFYISQDGNNTAVSSLAQSTIAGRFQSRTRHVEHWQHERVPLISGKQVSVLVKKLSLSVSHVELVSFRLSLLVDCKLKLAKRKTPTGNFNAFWVHKTILMQLAHIAAWSCVAEPTLQVGP